VINVGYFSNQFVSSRGHGISRYAKKLHKGLSDYHENLKIIPISASANNSKGQIELIKKTTGLKLLPWGRFGTPIAWQFLNYPLLEMGVNCNIDLVHAVSLGYKIATKKPYVVTIHDIGPLTNPHFFSKKDQIFMKYSLPHAINKAAAFICVSQTTADELENYVQSNYNLSLRNRIHVIHEGVDSSFFKNSSIDELTEYKLVESFIDKPYLLAVGQNSPRKNLHTILQAFDKLKNELPYHQLVIVGSTFQKNDTLRTQIIKLGLEKRVHLLGYVSNNLLQCLYQKALVFVYPSLFEGFGLTILEAMASGCPVITTNISSLPEIGGDTALYINPNDDDELYNHIIHLTNDKHFRSQLSLQGIQRAKLFSWRKTALQTKSIYESII